jgi:hypothetical protein
MGITVSIWLLWISSSIVVSEPSHPGKSIKSYGYALTPSKTRGSRWLSLLTKPLTGRFGRFSFKKLTAASSRSHLRELGNLSRAIGVSYGRLGKVRKEFSRNIDSGWESSAIENEPSQEDLNSDLRYIQNSLSSNYVLRDGVLMCGGVLFASLPCSLLGHKVYPFFKFDILEANSTKGVNVDARTCSSPHANSSESGKLIIDLKSVPNSGLLPSLRGANDYLWIRMEINFDNDKSLLFRVRTSPAVDASPDMSVLISGIVDAFATKISKIAKVRSVQRRALERHQLDVAAADRLMQFKRLNDSIYDSGHSKNKLRRGDAAAGASGSSRPTRYRPSESTQERRSPKPKGGGG